jgi:hypothetical protein
LRLATSLPFLKVDTALDITLSPDVEVGAKGWVSSVALETGADGMPRLVIDVRVAHNDGFDPWHDPSTDFSSALTPVVEPIVIPPPEVVASPLDAVPEHVWEAADHAVTTALTAADFQDEEPLELSEAVPTAATSSPTLPFAPHVEVPISSSMVLSSDVDVDVAPSIDAPITEGPGASPAFESADQTEIVSIERPPTRRWRALGGGALAGAVGLAAFVGAVALMHNAPPHVAVPSLAPPVIVTRKAAAAELPPIAPPPDPIAPAAAVPAAVVAAQAPAVEAKAAEPPAAAPSSDFVVGLTGSLAGSRRYPLRNPDGVAFNLPHAQATMKVGTYRPDVPGLRSFWVRPLPGGGTHLRFHFTDARPAPHVELTRTGVRITAP